jgi:hypothetical protein
MPSSGFKLMLTNTLKLSALSNLLKNAQQVVETESL